MSVYPLSEEESTTLRYNIKSLGSVASSENKLDFLYKILAPLISSFSTLILKLTINLSAGYNLLDMGKGFS